MSREEIIATITSRLKDERLAINRRARFKAHPLKTAWFYTIVALNRYVHFLIPIYGTTVWGHRLKAYETSAIGSISFLGFYDSDITLFLLKYYQGAGDILDVGANIGIHSSLFSYLAHPKSKVIAFEPTPSTCRVLKANMQQCHNVTVEERALSDTIGNISFIDYGLRHGVFNSSQAQPHAFLQKYGKKISVPSCTLDAYCVEHGLKPDLIKLDTEGTEANILRHSTQTLNQYKPTIILELGGGEAWAPGINQCFDILTAQGYHFFNATKDGTPFRHDRQPTYQYENLIAIHKDNLPTFGISAY